MDKDKKLRKVTQHVWDFIYFKLVRTSERPIIKGSSGINPDMIKLLRMVIWTGTYVSLSEWRGFLYEHYIRMTSSPKLFATYVIYACYITKHFSQVLDAYQTFLRTISLVVQFALYSSNDRQEELLSYSQEIFIDFFEKELKKEFKKQGGWKSFGGYLQQRNPLELYKMLEQLEQEGQSPGQIVRILGMIPSKSDPLREYLNLSITEAAIESYEPTSRILKSLGYLHEAKSDKLRTEGLHNTNETQRNTCTKKTKSKPEFRTKSSEHDSNVALATGAGKGAKQSKGAYKQAKQTIRPAKRITTRQTYIRAKEIIQDLRFDFQMLEELLEFVFGDTSTES